MMTRTNKAGWREIGDKRCYFKSAWEANYARYLQWLKENGRIIDWEYAGMGDRFFDLGNFAVNQSLNEEQCEDLLQHYFGMVRTPDLAHLHLMRLTSDLRESFWGFLQLGISTLDFDYHEYAYRHLNRFLQNAATPQFTQWLHAIQA